MQIESQLSDQIPLYLDLAVSEAKLTGQMTQILWPLRSTTNRPLPSART